MLNSGQKIQKLKDRMVSMQQVEGNRDWEAWNQMQRDLQNEYRREEVYWAQKSSTMALKR